LGVLWALEWAWHIVETNFRSARSSGICMSNPNSLAPIVSEISAFIRTDGKMASDPDQEYIYFMESETSPSLRCKLLTEIIILSARVYKY